MKQSINKKVPMSRKLFLAAMAVIAFSACSDQITETPLVVNSPQQETQGTPIMFGSESSQSKRFTRANYVGAEAANLLNNKFVVAGFKGSSTASVGSIVFDNYLVEYAENTAYTTESNTRNWEYVGKGLIKHAETNGITSQSMKYWDYSKPQYDFIAWSTGKKTAIYEGTPAAGQVLVSAIDPSSLGTAAYSYTGRSADLIGCYIADIVTRKKAQYGDDPVTIKFRSLGSKVRMGIYETIPGYSVRNVEFYSAANTGDLSSSPRLFTTNAASLIYNSGTYTVYYPTVSQEGDPDNNQAHVKFDGTGDQSSIVDFGSLNYVGAEESEKTSGSVFLGRSSNHASMAGEAEGNYFTQYLPNETGINLNLRVNYVLESTDGSGEIIEVKGASCQVPSAYTQWKSGYAYTYLFKISDRTNGYATDDAHYDPIGGGPTDNTPAGLYPITFDAIVINTEDGDQAQETITLVSTPSITTYMEGQVVVNNNEYKVTGKPLYVTVGENNALVTLTASNAAMYKLDNNTCTEADIVDVLTYSSDNTGSTIMGRNGIEMSKQTVTPVSTIEYGVDGNPIDLGENKAVKFQPSAGTFAFVYTQSDPTVYNDIYVPVSKRPYEDVTGLYRNFNLTAASGIAVAGKIYFSMDADGKLTQAFPTVGQDSVDGLYLYVSDAAGRYPCLNGEKAVSGHGYFDKFTKNNGVYYTKVIKVVN